MLPENLSFDHGSTSSDGGNRASEGPDSVSRVNEKMPSTGSSSGGSLDGRHLSCKRKAIEQSSGAGSSNYSENATNVSIPPPAANSPVFNNEPEPTNPLSSDSTATLESRLRRHFRLRALHELHNMPDSPLSTTDANVGNSDVSSSRHSSTFLHINSLFDSNPTPPAENGSHHGLHIVPPPRLNITPMLYGESTSGNIPRSISEHPMFVAASDISGSSQQPTNSNLGGGSNPIAENIASTSRANSSSPSPAWSRRSDLYRRRLQEIIQRSISSVAGSSSAVRSQEAAIASNTRLASLERHLDGAGILQSLPADNEARNSAISEMRRALRLMRRGDGLRVEDMAMHDHPFLFGIAGIHDRHRDMRLDVDNMSYEELLALEDRIGNVCTGLNEETITSRLKRRKYAERRADDGEIEPCCICREEYNDGEDVGTLECGHDFHKECVKQWLLIKNLCPICKTTGLSSSA